MPTVAGLVPFTTIDYPGCLAAVVFFKGCPLRCPFCHNPNLQVSNGQSDMAWDEVVRFMASRQGKLDALVLSGGEPLMQPDILPLCQQIKQMGFKVGIHTSGVYPEKLNEIVPFVDWVGLDIKAPWEKYDILCGRPNRTPKVQESLKVLLKTQMNFECRTTCDPAFLTPQDVIKMATELKQMEVKNYALQAYHTFEGDKNPPSQRQIDAFFTTQALAPIKEVFPNLIIR